MEKRAEQGTTAIRPPRCRVAFKMRFSSTVTIKGLVIPSSTKVKDTIDFSEYVEQIRSWSREFLNMEIPDPQKVRI